MRILYEPVYSTFIPDNRDEDRAFKQALTFFDPKSQWNPKYRMGYWDGCVRFWKDNKFCTGLISYAEEKLGKKFVVEDLPKALPHKLTPDILNNLSFTGKYSYQYDVALSALEAKRGILWLATNAGKTAVVAGMIKALEIPTLFLVESVDLMRQTYDVFKSEIDLDIGMLGGGQDDVKFVTVALTKSALIRSKEKGHPFKSFIRDVQMVISDECHGAANYTYSTVLQKCINANYRYGLSGTPLDRGEIDSMRLIAYTGPVIERVTNTELIDLGVSAKPTVYIHKADTTGCANNLHANYPEAYSELIVYNDARNKQIVDLVKKGLAENKVVMILVKQIAHGRVLQMRLEGEGIDVDFCFGGSGKEERYININKLRKKISRVLIMSKIGEVGIDIPSIDVLIRASGGKSTVSTLQSIGRGLRAKKDKANVIDYHDFIDSGNTYLNAHSKARICDYEREEFDIIYDNN